MGEYKHCYSKYINHILNNSPSKISYKFTTSPRFKKENNQSNQLNYFRQLPLTKYGGYNTRYYPQINQKQIYQNRKTKQTKYQKYKKLENINNQKFSNNIQNRYKYYNQNYKNNRNNSQNKSYRNKSNSKLWNNLSLTKNNTKFQPIIALENNEEEKEKENKLNQVKINNQPYKRSLTGKNQKIQSSTKSLGKQSDNLIDRTSKKQDNHLKDKYYVKQIPKMLKKHRYSKKVLRQTPLNRTCKIRKSDSYQRMSPSGYYPINIEMNPQGKSVLSNYKNTISYGFGSNRVDSRSKERKKMQIDQVGPGKYNHYSEFGGLQS